MNELIFGFDKELAAWASSRIKYMGEAGFGDHCRAIGVSTPAHVEPPQLLAVVVYHAWDEACGTCQISIAADSPRWAQRGVIRALLSVPFVQYKCRKVWSLIPSDNHRSAKLCKGLGFRPEGTLRHQFADGTHAMFFGLLAKEYRARYLKVPNGKEIRPLAA